MAEKTGPEPGDRVVIGITFGNSNSSIAYTVDDKAEVIANEDGGECFFFVCVCLDAVESRRADLRV